MLSIRATVQFTIELPIDDAITGPASSLGEITKRAAQSAQAQVEKALGGDRNYVQTPVVLSVTINAAADDAEANTAQAAL